MTASVWALERGKWAGLMVPVRFPAWKLNKQWHSLGLVHLEQGRRRRYWVSEDYETFREKHGLDHDFRRDCLVKPLTFLEKELESCLDKVIFESE